MTIETEIANLATQATALLGAVNTSKSTLDEKVATATTQAVTATTKASDANASAGQSAGSAAQALQVYATAAAMNAALATAAAQSSAAQTAAASASSILQQDLAAVSAALHRSPNAVTAMCIYDTSKDSEGGSWPDRMGHTSWMNEPLNGAWRGALASEAAARAISGAATDDYFQLNTDGKFYKLNAGAGVTEVFRGNTAKLSRMPLPIAEANTVTLYSATEPGRPMWGRWAFAAGTFGTITSVAAANSKVLIGTTLGLITLDFAKDEGRFQQVAADRTFKLTDRASGSQVLLNRSTQTFIVNNAVSAVAACVLPDAPFDVVTGLQVPTISVFTVGGISVIQDTGAVVNSAVTTAFTAGKLDADGILGVNATGVHVSAKPRSLTAGFAMTSYLTTTSPALLGVPTVMAGSKAMKEFGNASGVTVIKENPSTPARGLSARIASTYNTGWMGDIRRAYLCDTEAEAIGPSVELVTNGTFDGGTTGWSASGGATLEIVSGELKLTATPNVPGHAWQAMPTVVGRSYAASATVRSPTNAGITMRIGTTIGGASNGSTSTFSATNVPMNQLFVATATTTYISFINGIVSGGPSIIDNVSLKEVIPDRSYKAASASIYGTLVKSPVSPGSRLVAWSGFSTTNYGQEPYSADMDYGVGEWSVGAWVSTTGYGPHNVVTASESSWVTPAATSIVGFDSSHQIADNASVRTTYKTFAGIVGQIYTTSVFVQMDDNSAPVVTQSASTGDFAVVAHGVIAGVDTGAPPAVVTHIGGNVYRVSVTAAASSTNSTWGVVKYTGSTAKGFRLTGIQVNRGTLQPYYKTVASPFNGVAVVVERSAATGPSLQLGLNGSGQLTATAYDGTTTRTVTTTAAYNTGVFTKARATYLATGKLGITVNGVEVASATGTPLLTMSNANAVLTIGNSRTLDAPFPGSLTLVKLGATVPTPEQSQWMYEQEKQMFRADAQITLPAATPVLDLTYDESQDKWTAVQAGNESSFTGLIRTATAAVSAGSFTKVDTKSGVKLLSRSTTNPGVDVTIPAYGLREELVRRGEAAAKASKTLTVFDFDAVAAQTDFQLPMGWTATEVLSAGASQREGTTKAWTRQFDGFRETVKFAVAPGAAVWVQITARKE